MPRDVWNLTMRPLARRMLGFVCVAGLVGGSTAATERRIVIPKGAGSFVFVDARGDASKRMTVYTYLPKSLSADTAPIVFVMHGHNKSAERYRDRWSEEAERHKFMVIAPRFDPEQWGGGAYSYASVLTRKGKVADPTKWSFSVVEHLFDAVRQATGNKGATYRLYGHSEGGQFVHRLVLFLPDARYARAVTANSGWYTMPKFDVKYPYGLAGSPETAMSLKKSLARDVIVMLGDRDNDPRHPDLRRGPEADAQGPNRNARGKKFFNEAKARAAELGAPFNWRLEEVRGGIHDDATMHRAAAAALMAR